MILLILILKRSRYYFKKSIENQTCCRNYKFFVICVLRLMGAGHMYECYLIRETDNRRECDQLVYILRTCIHYMSGETLQVYVCWSTWQHQVDTCSRRGVCHTNTEHTLISCDSVRYMWLSVFGDWVEGTLSSLQQEVRSLIYIPRDEVQQSYIIHSFINNLVLPSYLLKMMR